METLIGKNHYKTLENVIEEFRKLQSDKPSDITSIHASMLRSSLCYAGSFCCYKDKQDQQLVSGLIIELDNSKYNIHNQCISRLLDYVFSQ